MFPVPSQVVVEDPNSSSPYHHQQQEEDPEYRTCRYCPSEDPLFLDWSQGDRVCTNCGVVDEERVCDTRADWKDFQEADDLAKGLPSLARCGMIPVDESKYIGGLQPTTLSSQPFGGTTGVCSVIESSSKSDIISAERNMRKRLRTTNMKMDRMMQNLHNKALENARLSRKILQRRRLQNKKSTTNGETTATESDLDSVSAAMPDDVPPEYDRLVLQEEEDIQRVQAALNADKWNLQRAILLHGSGQEISAQVFDNNTNREDLIHRLDHKLKKASFDLYTAYTMLHIAAKNLNLPDRITAEATNMLCAYAARRDGFIVKGVSSRLAIKTPDTKIINNQSLRNEASQRLRQHNKIKQMGALCSALLFLISRNLGWTRSLNDVCNSIEQPTTTQQSKKNTKTNSNNVAGATTTTSTSTPFIKSKHCSRAIDELKTTFPDYSKSILASVHNSAAVATALGNKQQKHKLQYTESDIISTANFVDHSLRKLNLPPVASASIRTLVNHYRRQQIEIGVSSGTKLSTICASIAYFVCITGSIMQRLAIQAHANDPRRYNNQHQSMVTATIMSSKTNNHGNHKRKKPAYTTTTTTGMLQNMNEDSRTNGRSFKIMKKSNSPKVKNIFFPKEKKKVFSAKDVTCIHTTVASNDKTSTSGINYTSMEDIINNDLDSDDDDDDDDDQKGGDRNNSNNDYDCDDKKEEEDDSFDVFTHDAKTDDILSAEAQNREYIMRRVWDTWAEQMPWYRTLGEVEHSCGVSGNVIMEYYKSNLYPRRHNLLEVLRDAVATINNNNNSDKQGNHASASATTGEDDKNNSYVSTTAAASAADTPTTTSTITEEDSKFLVETPLASTLLSQICVAGNLLQRQVEKNISGSCV